MLLNGSIIAAIKDANRIVLKLLFLIRSYTYNYDKSMTIRIIIVKYCWDMVCVYLVDYLIYVRFFSISYVVFGKHYDGAGI